ncbi:amiloride-sensitive sodium channel subunit beta-2-like [Haliotis rubra]|uniref:amiloride-sensitive sodium channel subunit beta-2-like n=1 Tax=Haliotis rubra TaxID=36100 RepID=UPI001EE563E1|nr:amiloride-sensitive sodium channel subunit beta-2-like [Haliotis rubra]
MAGDVCDQVSSGKSLRSILQRFADRTSMQGVSFLRTSRSWYARVIWSSLLLTSLAMLFYHLTYLIQIYYSWPKHTSMSIGFSPLPFPTITICNTNPVRLSQMKNVSRELKMFFEKTNPNYLAQELERENRKTILENTASFGLININFTTVDYFTQMSNIQTREQGREMGLNESSTSANIQIEFQNLFMKETRQRRIAIGHQLDDMMMDCSFACQTCSQRHFIRKTSSTFGNCYTLEHTKFVSKRSGPTHGLQLILNLENYEQLEGITTGNGFQLVVNPHGMLPFPVHDGITIDAGKETNIALKKVAIHRLGAPKWDCEDGEMFRRKYNITYSVQTCQLLCEHEMISNTCKCYHVSEEEMIILMNTTKAYPACRTKKQVRCVLDQMALFETTTQNCSCGNPCRETKYEKRLSSRQWPSHSYANVLKQKRCKVISAADCAKLNIPPTDLSLNFAKLNIFYEDLNYEVMKEEPDYELTQFVSDVGGTLGLWVGLSVLSIFELVQLLLELSTFATCSACRANGPDDDTQKLKEKKPPDFLPSYPSNPTGHISGFSGY